MRTHLILFLTAALLLPASLAASAFPELPHSFKSGDMVRAGEQKNWAPDDMYEHVNGEAELLKRYGAAGLSYVYYENKGGDYLSVDILDMAAPVNGFGLYSLYAGCDGDEYNASGATVLSGEFTSYAIYGRYFLRIDFEAKGGMEGGRSLVRAFLSMLVSTLPEPEPLPPAVSHLKRLARKPCETGYHPEHVDYDLEAGPGYTWVGPGGGTFFMSFFTSSDKAKTHSSSLRARGVTTVFAMDNAVGWTRSETTKDEIYLKKALDEAVKW